MREYSIARENTKQGHRWRILKIRLNLHGENRGHPPVLHRSRGIDPADRPGFLNVQMLSKSQAPAERDAEADEKPVIQPTYLLENDSTD